MYKDKEKQKEANRLAKARQRQGMTQEGMTGDNVIPKPDYNVIPDSECRGKDIKRFEHLPLDVQRTINRLTTLPDGTVDEQARANRTAIAINYQHYRPDRYHNTGVALSGHRYAGVVYAKEASIFNEG